MAFLLLIHGTLFPSLVISRHYLHETQNGSVLLQLSAFILTFYVSEMRLRLRHNVNATLSYIGFILMLKGYKEIVVYVLY